mmetsp:Transcript_7464/g.16042  ORF Transcript_7464/g.16042 Transcript_7464/m.16042 type:complete len:229 (+) Transcript_7464:849-1535(+)
MAFTRRSKSFNSPRPQSSPRWERITARSPMSAAPPGLWSGGNLVIRPKQQSNTREEMAHGATWKCTRHRRVNNPTVTQTFLQSGVRFLPTSNTGGSPRAITCVVAISCSNASAIASRRMPPASTPCSPSRCTRQSPNNFSTDHVGSFAATSASNTRSRSNPKASSTRKDLCCSCSSCNRLFKSTRWVSTETTARSRPSRCKNPTGEKTLCPQAVAADGRPNGSSLRQQ